MQALAVGLMANMPWSNLTLLKATATTVYSHHICCSVSIYPFLTRDILKHSLIHCVGTFWGIYIIISILIYINCFVSDENNDRRVVVNLDGEECVIDFQDEVWVIYHSIYLWMEYLLHYGVLCKGRNIFTCRFYRLHQNLNNEHSFDNKSSCICNIIYS